VGVDAVTANEELAALNEELETERMRKEDSIEKAIDNELGK
jgi:hypothetical protein